MGSATSRPKQPALPPPRAAPGRPHVERGRKVSISVPVSHGRRHSLDADAQRRRLSQEAAERQSATRRDTLHQILTNRDDARLFEVFLHNEYRVDLLRFLRACERFEAYLQKCLSLQAAAPDAMAGSSTRSANAHALRRGREVYERFLAPAAAHPVHAAAKDCLLTKAMLDDGSVPVTLFHNAKRAVVATLADEMLPRFVAWMDTDAARHEMGRLAAPSADASQSSRNSSSARGDPGWTADEFGARRRGSSVGRRSTGGSTSRSWSGSLSSASPGGGRKLSDGRRGSSSPEGASPTDPRAPSWLHRGADGLPRRRGSSPLEDRPRRRGSSPVDDMSPSLGSSSPEGQRRGTSPRLDDASSLSSQTSGGFHDLDSPQPESPVEPPSPEPRKLSGFKLTKCVEERDPRERRPSDRRASDRSARFSDPELGDGDRRRSSLLGDDDALADELAVGIARVEAHVAAPSPDLVAGAIQRHVEHSVLATNGRVARVSDPVITSDMVRRKSSMDLEDAGPDAL